MVREPTIGKIAKLAGVNVETIRFLTKDTAIADGRYEINDRKMWSTFLMVRTPDGWKIGAIRNMLPAK